MQNQIENLFFITHEEEPIIINREDGLSVVDLQNPALSINILEIFNLNLNDLADSNTSLIRSKLNSRFEVTRETTTLTITESNPALPPNVDDNPDAPIAKVYNPCDDYWEFEMPVQYANWINSHFSPNIFSVSESDLKLYWSETLTEVDINIFREAGLACAGDINYCICPSFECFVKNLAPLIDGDQFPDTKEKISKLALIQQLHLSPEEQACLDGAGGIYSELADILGNNLISPCSLILTPEELMRNAIENMATCSLDGFYDALNELNEDYIRTSKGVKQECPKIACIIEKITTGSLASSFICDLLNNFENSKTVHFIYKSKDFTINPDIPDNADAATGVLPINPLNPVIVLNTTFNSAICENSDLLYLLETIQHELVHADIKRRLVEEFNWDPSNEGTLLETFSILVLETFGENSTIAEHELMLEYYLQKMVDSLIEMNNGVGNYNDFVGLILDGMPVDILNYCGYSVEDVQQKYNQYLSFYNGPENTGTLKSELSDCN